MHHPTDRIVVHGLYYTSRGALDGMKKWLNGSTTKDRSDDPSQYERALYHGARSGSLISEIAGTGLQAVLSV